MRTSIEAVARKMLQNNVSRLTIQKQLGLDQIKSSAVIDRSLEGIVTELSKLSADKLSGRRIHAEITGADTSYTAGFLHDKKRASSLESAGKQLDSLIGADGKTRLSEALIKGHKLTQSQADDALGFASPAVIDVIKTNLTDGSFTNNAAGLSAALKTTSNSGAAATATKVTTPTSTSTKAASTSTKAASTSTKAASTSTKAASTSTKATSTSTNTSAAYVAGSSAVAASEPSWLMRFWLPLLLLGALILGTVKFCGDAEKGRVVTEERDQLQLNLAGAEEQNAKTSDELASLQTDYDESQSTVESLKSDLQSTQTEFQALTTEHEGLRDDLGVSNAELEKLRDLPTDAVGLQQQLIGTIQERDDARAAETMVLEKLKSVEADRDQTQERNESLKFDIDTAQKNINSNATLISGFRSQVDELSVQRDNIDTELKTTSTSLEEEKANVVRLTKEGQELEGRVGELTNTVEQLDAEIVSLTEQKKALESSLQTTQASLDSEREGRESDNSNFTADAATLQAQVANLTNQSDSTEATLSERNNEIAQQAASINELQLQVETLETEKAQAADSKKLLDEKIAELEQDYDQAQTLIEERDNTLAERKTEFDATSDTLSATQEEVALLEKERDELSASIDELNKKAELLTSDRNSAMTEIDLKDSKNTELSGELQALKTQSSEEIEALTQENADLNENLVQAIALGTNLKGIVDSLNTQNDQLEADGVAYQQSLSGSEQEIAKLAEARDKLQAEVAATGAVINAIEGDTKRARQAIAEKLSAAGVEDVQVNSIDNNRAVAITLGSNILFSAGDVSMSPQGSRVLREVGKAIADYQDWRIDVEGHTDSLPIGQQLSVFYPTNWELSSARASAVIHRLRFGSNLNAESMSARGFADTQPVAENTSARGREKNRRVDIVLRR